MTEGERLTQLYPPASCFCSEVHTESHIYYCNGEYLDADTGEPIKDLNEDEISISNVVCDSSKLCGYNGSESLDYSIDLKISDIINKNPTMSSISFNNSLAAGASGGDGVGHLNYVDMRGNADSVEGAPSPYNGS